MLYPLSYEGGGCVCRSEGSCLSPAPGLVAGGRSSCPIEIA